MQSRITNQKEYWNKLAERYNHRFNYHSACGEKKIGRKIKLLINGAGIGFRRPSATGAFRAALASATLSTYLDNDRIAHLELARVEGGELIGTGIDRAG